MKVFDIRVSISRQEDGLWRAEVPALPGCFVDAETLTAALQEIQSVAAMMLNLDIESGQAPLAAADEGSVFDVRLPLVIEEHAFDRLVAKARDAG